MSKDKAGVCLGLRYLATVRSDSNILVMQSRLGATDTLMKMLPLMLPLMKTWNFLLPTMRLLESGRVFPEPGRMFLE